MAEGTIYSTPEAAYRYAEEYGGRVRRVEDGWQVVGVERDEAWKSELEMSQDPQFSDVIIDENKGMRFSHEWPKRPKKRIKYSKGGAIRGKTFRGNY
tara:strand:- start:690 stop:980 length:291 start_codon:yes stop_codon:yes gene_type:complete